MRSHSYITQVGHGAPTTISRATQAVPVLRPHFPSLFSRSLTPGPPPFGIDELDAGGINLVSSSLSTSLRVRLHL
jgi:hypothetical protein